MINNNLIYLIKNIKKNNLNFKYKTTIRIFKRKIVKVFKIILNLFLKNIKILLIIILKNKKLFKFKKIKILCIN